MRKTRITKAFSLLFAMAAIACQSGHSEQTEATGHSSQAITIDLSQPIGQKWQKVGGANNLGEPTTAIQPTPNLEGEYQLFANGAIVYSNDFGAVVLPMVIFDRWLASQGEVTEDGVTTVYAYIGLPTSDFAQNGALTSVAFEKGMIVAEAAESHVVYGAMYRTYLTTPDVFGKPTTDAANTPVGGGRQQSFANGAMFWQPGTAGDRAFFVQKGPIFDRWFTLGGISALGFPISDTQAVVTDANQPIGLFSRFEYGSIYFSPTTGAWEVKGDLRKEYETTYGGPTGWLGFPTSGENYAAPGPYNNYQYGVLINAFTKFGGPYILPFGRFDFHLDRVMGYGSDCFLGICGSIDLYFYLRACLPEIWPQIATLIRDGACHANRMIRT